MLIDAVFLLHALVNLGWNSDNVNVHADHLKARSPEKLMDVRAFSDEDGALSQHDAIHSNVEELEKQCVAGARNLC